MTRHAERIVCLGIVALLGSVAPASALTAAVAKKCEAAALQAFPNQRVGTNIGTSQRNKFRQQCIANDGNIPSPEPQAAPQAGAPAI